MIFGLSSRSEIWAGGRPKYVCRAAGVYSVASRGGSHYIASTIFIDSAQTVDGLYGRRGPDVNMLLCQVGSTPRIEGGSIQPSRDNVCFVAYLSTR